MADSTTTTLYPVSGKEHGSATQIALTFAATPPEFTPGKIARIRIEIS
jgi:hypothetical protein